jgi:drug/metabolite transporter (DMT)-like permease
MAFNDLAEHRSQGILWMLATGVCFIALDAIMKHLMESLPLVQVTWARFFFGTVFALAFAWGKLPQLLVTRAPLLQLLRSVLLMSTTGAFNFGIRHTPLATATTIMFMSPILVTLLSIPLLGEKVGIRRWLGILTGFAGALLVVRPWSEGISTPMAGLLFLLLAALLNANYQLLTRMVRGDDPLTSLIYTAAGGAIVTSLMLPWTWQTPSLSQWVFFVASGLAGGLGHLCLIRSLRLAPASVVAPFSYASLVWAVTLGFIVWGDWPDAMTVMGAVLIVAAGLYIFNRERTLKKHTAASTAAGNAA